MSFISIACPRTGRPIKVASKKRARRMMVNAQREYLRDKSKASTPQSDFEGMGSAVLPYQVFEPSSSEGIRSYTVAQKKVVHSYETTDFEETREIIAQRLIRHEKAAPQRKRRLK